MQLVGNIEDLGLGEILQIVCFSRKSGTLRLNSRKREGSIVFRNGQVIRAASSRIKEGVCDILVKEGIATPEQIREAKEIQISRGFTESLGSILIKDIQLNPDQVEDTATRLIEKIVHSLFLWLEGSFVFELADFAETPETIKNDPLHYTLVSGINPQFLAMEGSRLLDEFKREGGVPEEETAKEEIVPEPVPVKEVTPAEISREGTILIVDDDPLTRGVLRNHLVQSGFKAVAFGQPEAVLNKVEELTKKREIPIVIADMFMPRMDGEGMLGGVEILSRLKKEFPDVPVIIITEHQDSKAEKEVMGLNAYSCLLKPKKFQFKEDVTTPEVSSFLENLEKTLNQLAKREEKTEPKFFMQEYLKELEGGEPFLESGYTEPKVEESKGLRVLKEMLSELSKPLSVSEVVLLTLRFSSEIVNRAVVFAVKKEGIAGLGQFGIEIKGESPDKRVRRMMIPLNEPSILKDSLDQKASLVKRLDPIPWNDYIVRELGSYLPSESFVVPLIVQGKVLMLLYGDNAPGNDRIGDISTLEIFLAQASIALERTILEKKLSETGR